MYKNGLYGEKYVWIIPSQYAISWHKQLEHDIDCTADQMGEALEGHLTAVTGYPEESATDVGMVRAFLYLKTAFTILKHMWNFHDGIIIIRSSFLWFYALYIIYICLFWCWTK